MEVPTVPILYLISHRDLTMTSETFSGPVNTRMKKEKLLAIATALALDPRPSTVANIVSEIKKQGRESRLPLVLRAVMSIYLDIGTKISKPNSRIRLTYAFSYLR